MPAAVSGARRAASYCRLRHHGVFLSCRTKVPAVEVSANVSHLLVLIKTCCAHGLIYLSRLTEQPRHSLQAAGWRWWSLAGPAVSTKNSGGFLLLFFPKSQSNCYKQSRRRLIEFNIVKCSP